MSDIEASSSQWVASQVLTFEAQHALGKLTASERIDLLCDERSFEELSADEPEAPNDPSVIIGSGTIHGRRVFVFAKDQTHSQGSLSAIHAAMICAIQARAMAAQAPLIGLYDSGGMRLEDGLAVLVGYGEIIKHHADASGVIPQVSLLMGPCIGGDALAVALTDFVFMVRETSSLFVTGPEITNRLTGEEFSQDELGGTELHVAQSGLAAAAFADDITALAQLRRLIDFLPSSRQDAPPAWPSFDRPDRAETALDSLVPDAPATPYDVTELIFKIADENDFFELHARFAKNIVVGFGRLAGQTTGFIAHQPSVLGGVIDADAAQKAGRFIGFCADFHIPLVTFVDTPGFLPGLDQEKQPLAMHGAKLMAAYAQARVKKVTVILGQAYGPAFIAMGSKPLGSGNVLAWPSARIGLMKAKGAEFTADQAFAQGIIDAIIEPRRTRAHVIKALSNL